MGRLYDRRDLAWNTLFWNRKEQELSADVANGLMPASVLNSVITYPSRPRVKGDVGGFLEDDNRPSRHMRLKDAFEYERQKERFKLLKTGRLLQNLQAWERIFKACSNCHQEPSKKSKSGLKDVPCAEHEEGYRKARSDVWWAGEHNEAERISRGQQRPDEVVLSDPTLTIEDGQLLKSMGITNPTDEPRNPLNKWEEFYQRDKAKNAWTPLDARNYDVECNYKGWLNMLLQNEEITEREYLDELERLRREANETEFTTRAVAGTNAKVKRDSRYNQLSN